MWGIRLYLYVNLIFFMNIFNKDTILYNIPCCIIQQLFRQKIGQTLEQGIVDDILFPLLRGSWNLPKELLLDIGVTGIYNERT